MHHKTNLRPVLDASFYKELISTIKVATQKSNSDILVFLPGLGEIQRTQEQLESLNQNFAIVNLHGSLSLEEQQKALRPQTNRKIILATNIAESSLTIDGVGLVIDTGLSKVQKFDLKTGFSRLDLSRISLSSATQRAGRAARQFAGVCYRLWHSSEEASMSSTEVPEIQRTDLTESLLFLAAMGISDFQNFSWFESPSVASLQKCRDILLSLQAIDTQNRITPLGKKMIQLPLHPRLSALLLTAESMQVLSLGIELAAILQERDFLKDGVSAHYVAENFECDMSLRLSILQETKKNRSNDIIFSRLQPLQQSIQQLQKLLPDSKTQAQDVMIQKLLLHSFKDRLCRRRGKSDKAIMVGGRGVKLDETSVVKNSELFLALSGRESNIGSETLIPYACGLTKSFVLDELKIEIEQKNEIYFDEEKQKFLIKKYRAFRGLPLEEPILENAESKDIQSKMLDILKSNWSWVFKQNAELKNWWTRYEYFIKNNPQAKLTDTNFDSALQMVALGESDLMKVIQKDITYFLENEMDKKSLAEFKEQVPAKILMPSGSWIAVNYPDDKAPYLEVRIQEVFGMKETPKVLGGKISIVFHLLAPNYRPTQVTADLKSFWLNGYPEVKKELKLRYPKHSWPEDPLTAPAVAKGRPKK